MKEIVLPPYGFVELLTYNASDNDVVQAARISYDKHELQANEPWLPLEKDEKLIHYLIREGHHSVLEHTFFKFHVKAPLFVLREWYRHRYSSFSEVSGRYVDLKPEFYIPDKYGWRTQVGKPGHYEYEDFDWEHCPGVLPEQEVEDVCRKAFSIYRNLLEKDIARELARMVLPLNIYSEIIWSCNARGLFHFLSLRNAGNAQKEIALYAEVIESVLENIMPITTEAFRAYGQSV